MSEKLSMADALREAGKEVLAWAGSQRNNGPFSDEAYRTCIHIAGALNIAADRMEGLSP